MINLTLNDRTQNEIKSHILLTEKLLSKAASKASGSHKEASILLLPDLGIPRGARRIHGGFFVGAFYSWDTSVPIVPVDATVNCCGVSLYRLKRPIKSRKDFIKKISSAKENVIKTSYIWNFNTSNHFISYGKITQSNIIKSGYYVILHSSACEFKNQYNGLYPVKGNWFYHSIKSVRSNVANRKLRYIDDRKAEDFIKTAHMLETYNKIRQNRFAEIVFGKNNIEEEILNCQHYGMPTRNSIAIGCQWLYGEGIYLLLTNKDSPVYIIWAKKGFNNTVTIENKDIILVPHGLGNISIIGEKIQYSKNMITIGTKSFDINGHLEFGKDIALRKFSKAPSRISEAVTLEKILSKCPGKVIGKILQIYNYNYNSAI